jgi:hypothetical protein
MAYLNIGMNGDRKWALRAVILLIVLASVATYSCSVPRTIVLGTITGVVLANPSDRDEFFNAIAVNFRQPSFCERIGWRADASYGGWDFHPRTLRSKCRQEAAPPPSIGFSEVPYSMALFADQVRALGYTDADVTQSAWAAGPYETPVYEVYKSLLSNQEFRSRLRAGANYDEPRDQTRLRPAKPLEFLYQMVALDADETALCSKVSPNATFVDTGATALLRSRCFLSTAFNTRDIRFCEQLPPAASFPHINEIYDSRDRCRETVTIYSRPDFKGNPQYGSNSFPRAVDFHAALREAGYPVDALPAVPGPTPEDYWEFVGRLNHRAPADERAEFLRRVAAVD